ncbi:putative endo-1,4-beta-xylanase [Cladochytrium replicatum]|nr:putative endo-1,4-beta-xylanase [Cladochytrium replicatum]
MVALTSFYVIAAFVAASANRASGQGLNAMAQAKGRYFGFAADVSELQDSGTANLHKTHSGLITPGNQMKWDATEPQQNVFSYSEGEKIVSFAKANNLLVRGHTLVWHSQLPGWVSNGNWNNATLTAAMKNHIANVAGHFKGQLVHWDVVNEIFNEDGSLRDSPFSRNIGEAFVSIAFQAARAADPNAKLFINDYNLDYTGAKANAVINIVRKLRGQGVPIDGIGSQAHLVVGQISSSFGSVLQSFANLGVLVALTELDIRTNTPASTSTLNQQKTDYKTVVSACLAVANCVGIEVWGITDKYSWIPQTFPGQGAALPFDSNYQPKPAYYGITEALGGSAVTTAPGATSTRTTTTTTVIPPVTTTVQTSASPAPTNGGGNCSAKWGQCGGNGWTGPTCCVAGTTCTFNNAWYSQCL